MVWSALLVLPASCAARSPKSVLLNGEPVHGVIVRVTEALREGHYVPNGNACALGAGGAYAPNGSSR